MADEHHVSGQMLRQVSFDEIRVGRGVPIRGRRRRVTETGQVDQVDTKSMLEQNADAAQAVAIQTPAVQEHEMPRHLEAERFINEPGAVLFENGRSVRQSPS